MLWRFWTRERIQRRSKKLKEGQRSQGTWRNSTKGRCVGCERERFLDLSCIRFWRLIKTIWPRTLCCILLLNTARDLLISLLFLRALAGGKSQNGPKLFVLNYAFILHRLKRRGVWQPMLCGGKYVHIWQNHWPKMNFPPLKWKVLHVCVRARNRERDSNHLMNCVN